MIHPAVSRVPIILGLIFFYQPLTLVGQDSSSAMTDAQKQEVISTLLALGELSKPGLIQQGDSIVENEEFARLLDDSLYRQQIYPHTYSWEEAGLLLEQKEFKKALWYLINLYPESEENKLKTIQVSLALGSVIKIDEAFTNTFSTYCYTDPEVSTVVNGEAEIQRPDILESKMRDLKELLAYVRAVQERGS
jgi:hypothetical protein